MIIAVCFVFVQNLPVEVSDSAAASLLPPTMIIDCDKSIDETAGSAPAAAACVSSVELSLADVQRQWLLAQKAYYPYKVPKTHFVLKSKSTEKILRKKKENRHKNIILSKLKHH